MRDEPDIPIADQDWLDWAFDFAIAQLERGQAVRVDELLDGHEHLLTEVQRLLEVARQLVVGPAAALPTLHGYTLLRELGRGGMGVVYLARQERVAGRPVALKILPPGVAASSRARERFRGEAEAIAGVRHPNVVSIHDVIHEEGVLAYAMEWVEGKSLGELIAWLRQFPSPRTGSKGSTGSAVTMADLRGFLSMPADAAGGATVTTFICRIGIAVARGLSAVHAAGLVHRDVKPSNILLRRDGTPLLSDFGLARETDATLSEPGHFVGTMVYAPPEQLRGESGAIDARSDVYALGVTLYHALALRLPFQKRATKPRSHGATKVRATEAGARTSHGATKVRSDGATKGEEGGSWNSPATMLRMIERGQVTPLRRTAPRLPRDLETIVAKAMDADPARRYQSADELADDLERLLSFKPIRAKRAGPATRLAKLVRRNRAAAWGVIFGGILSLALATAAVVYVFLVPGWVAAHVRDARLSLLDPGQATNIVSVLFWGRINSPWPQQAETRRRTLHRALAEYDAALRWSPFDNDIRRERDTVEQARDSAFRAAGASLRIKRKQPPPQFESSQPSFPSSVPPDLRASGLYAYLTDDFDAALKAWGQYDSSRDSLSQPDPLVDAALGVLYLFDDQAARAYPRLQKAAEAFPNAGFILEYLADAAVKCGDTERGERWLRQSQGMSRIDAHGAGRRIEAAIHAARGHDASAEALYQTLPAGSPGMLEFARFLESRGRLREAVAQYARAASAMAGERVRQLFVEAADRWWAGVKPRTRLRMIRATLDEPPYASGSFVGLLRQYVQSHEATEPWSHEGIGTRHEATEPRSHEGIGTRHEATEPRSHEERKGNGNEQNERRRRATGDQDVSRFDRLAESEGTREGGLSQYKENARRREVRPDFADAQGGRLDSLEHRRGPRPPEPAGLSSIPPDGARLPYGTPDSIDSRGGTWIPDGIAGPGGPPSRDRPGASRPDPKPGKLEGLGSPQPSWLRGSVASCLLPGPSSLRGSVASCLPFGPLRGFVASWLRGFSWPLGPINSSPSLQSLSLSELAKHLEVENMSLWNRITSYPRILKELHFAAWRWPVLKPAVDFAAKISRVGLRQALVSVLIASGIAIHVPSVDAQCTTPPCFQGLGDLPGGATSSNASGLSGDGIAVVGASSSSASGSGNPEAFRWTTASGIVGLGDLPGAVYSSYASAVSADGSVVVGSSASGNSNFGPQSEAFRWTQASGMVGLGDHPDSLFFSQAASVDDSGNTIGAGIFRDGYQAGIWSGGVWTWTGWGSNSVVYGLSADGSIWIGGVEDSPGNGVYRQFRNAQILGEGDLPGGVTEGRAFGVSGDGSIVVGYGYSTSGREATRWTAAAGLVNIGDLPAGTVDAWAFNVSPDGALIVGYGTTANGSEAAIWDTSLTAARLADVLLANAVTIPAGWTLTSAADVTINAGVVSVCGTGINPQANTEAWIARYTLPPACEAPQVSQHPQSATIAAGANANFTVVATGTATLSYQWRKNTVNLNDGASGCSSTISGATTANLTIGNVSTSDNAGYDCVVTNACGSDTSDPATLTVPAGPACAGDMDGNNMVDGNDIDEFVAKLLDGGVCS